ncbi:MAG: GTP-binding protein [Desulfobacteraceae bacterium]|jgi:G3E family GTPase
MIVDIVFGFLGSGKTTFILRALERWGSEEKIVILVNEFGEVGIDGDLLSGQGADVVEMPSGCICCSIQSDFRSQMLDISRTVNPDRVIIEPTGVATIGQIRSIFQAQLFEGTIKKINSVLIADATGFMNLYKANRHFVESQVEHAHLALLNKCDKVDKKKAKVIQGAILAINPEITVLMTEFGAVDWADYQLALSTAPHSKESLPKQNAQYAQHLLSEFLTETTLAQDYHFQEEKEALGYESFGCVYEGTSFDRNSLETFFQQLKSADAKVGKIVRAKGLFQIGAKAVLIELASGEITLQPVRQINRSKVSIIGAGLNRDEISTLLQHCVSGEAH